MTHPVEIWAAAPTPFATDGQIDLGKVGEQARHMVSAGIDGAFVTGTTGEFPSLTVDERMALVERWRVERPDGLGFAVHVGHNQLTIAQRLAAQAESCGADMIAAVAPFYGETTNTDRIVSFLADVAAAAPNTPFCIYHNPSMTGSRHHPSDVVAAAIGRIPTLSSVKFTDADLLEMDRTRSVADHVKIYFGRDELLPAGVAFGAEAVIGSLYNGLAPIARRVASAVTSGDLARAFALHQPFRAIAAAAGTNGRLGFIKELMNQLGPDAGPARSPWGPLDPAEREVARRLADSVRPALEEAREAAPAR